LTSSGKSPLPELSKVYSIRDTVCLPKSYCQAFSIFSIPTFMLHLDFTNFTLRCSPEGRVADRVVATQYSQDSDSHIDPVNSMFAMAKSQENITLTYKFYLLHQPQSHCMPYLRLKQGFLHSDQLSVFLGSSVMLSTFRNC